MCHNVDVSIIIINYKTVDLIEACIQSVLNLTTGITYEIIVVDNASGDDCIPRLTNRFGDVLLKIIPLLQNIGFGRANNEGITHAKGRYIFCLNPDTIIVNNAIGILAKYLDMNPNCGACGGNLFDASHNPIHSYSLLWPGIKLDLSRIKESILGRNRYIHEFNMSNSPIEVAFITGADLMLRKSILDKVGMFDKNMFMYYEDVELQYRMFKQKYSRVNVPSAHIIHLEGQSTSLHGEKSINLRRLILVEEGHRLYAKKVMSYSERFCSKVLYLIKFFIKGYALHDKEARAKFRLLIKRDSSIFNLANNYKN